MHHIQDHGGHYTCVDIVKDTMAKTAIRYGFDLNLGGGSPQRAHFLRGLGLCSGAMLAYPFHTNSAFFRSAYLHLTEQKERIVSKRSIGLRCDQVKIGMR